MNGSRRIALAVLLVLALVGPITAVSAQTPAPTGPITIGVLAPPTDTPRNRKFVQAFRSKFGRDPGSPAAFTYAAMAAIDQAVGATGGHIADSAPFVEALRKTNVEAPQGRVRFDRYQNVVSDIYIGRIDKVGDQIVPVVIETSRNVDQFLGLDPVDYIKRLRLVTLKGSFAK
jgi:branched-chain amino acid transport system substrate-binding protein